MGMTLVVARGARRAAVVRGRAVAVGAATAIHLAVCGQGVDGQAAVDASESRDAPLASIAGQSISSRYRELYRAGLHAALVDVDEVDLPHEINAMLRAHALVWRELGGTLQRLLLWDAGFVLSSQRELVRVYVDCGLTMDEIILPRHQFPAEPCLSRVCNDSLTAVGPCSKLRPKCAVNGLDGHGISQVVSWSEEQPNADIPRPTIFRVANQSYAIHMLPSGDSATTCDRCPPQLRLAIPCAHVHSEIAEWCSPKPTGVVDALLETLQSSTTTHSDQTKRPTSLLMPILWLSVMCVAGVAGFVFVMMRRKLQTAQQRGADQTTDAKRLGAPMTSESELAFVSVCCNDNTFAETVNKTTRSSLGAFSSGGAHAASSFADLVNSSDVLRAFQTDPLIVQKRLPMEAVEFTRRLCHGANGDVSVGRVHGQRVAIKQLLQLKRNELDELEAFAREIQLTATLDHPNIIKMVGVAWTSLQNVALVLEYRSGGDLLDAIRKRGSKWSWNAEKLHVAIGVAKAMVYLHGRSHPLVHRDIKSRNILVDAITMEPALCDFGSSRNLSTLDLLSTDPAGTILWSAPEVIASQSYSVKADIFSFGVVLAELDTCALPYTDERDSEGRPVQAIRIAHMVVENHIKPQLSELCPRFIRELVMKCVKHKPEHRPTAEEVLVTLTEAAHDCAALWKSKPFGVQSV